MIKLLKSIIQGNPRVIYIIDKFRNKFFPVRGKNNRIENKGYLIGCKKLIIGDNNTIIIEKDAIIKNTFFHIYGNHNIIRVGAYVRMHEEGNSIWIDGNSNTIEIGNHTSIRSAHLCAQEKETSIYIGANCMLSNTIEIRTSDSHAIYNLEDNQRINSAKSIRIGEHVWISAKAVIMKGVTVGSGSVIGYGSLVTKNVPSNTIVAGRPAKVVKENIYWTKELH